MTVYKFGYVAWNNLFVYPDSKRRDETRPQAEISLERYPERESHARHLSFIDSARASGLYGDDRVPRFSRALAPERRMR